VCDEKTWKCATCLSNGNACSTPGDCCSDICGYVYRAGAYQCVQCINTGDLGCNQDQDCCAGNYCINGQCVSMDDSCPVGNGCMPPTSVDPDSCMYGYARCPVGYYDDGDCCQEM
jgi:hypothetical protein